MMLKTNYTNRYLFTRAVTAGMLILGVLLMGCDKDSKQQNQNVSAGQAIEPPAIMPAPSAPPSEFVPPPPEEKSDRDWSQPYQVMPIGDALIKIPRGYLIRRDYGDGNSKGLNEHMKLQTSIVLTPDGKPKFLTLDEARKFYENRKGQARYVSPFETYNTVYVDVNKSKLDFKNGTSAFDEKGVFNFVAFSSYYPTPPEILTALGLKAYRSRSGLNYLYFPLDTNFKKPNREVFYLDCDKTPTDPQAVASCRVGFIPKDKVSVGYTFPPQYLDHWKEIHQFVLNTLQFAN